MTYMQNREIDYFLYLLACALNDEKPEQRQGVDYNAILALAKKHQIYNIISSIIASMPDASDDIKLQFKNHNLSEITRMIAINNERNLIFDELTQNGIRFMPLKGLILKDYYPKESMRQMSDNDILFDIENRDIVAKIMKNFGYSAVATGENSDDYYKPPYCTFEFHRTLFFDENDFCPRFDNLWNNATPDENNRFMYHMGLDDVYVYNICHMYKHYSTAGCGVRFLADNYLFLKAENDNLNWSYINSKLNEFGILDYEKRSRELAFKIFECEELNANELKLLETYINNGIYGDGNISLEKSINSLSKNGSIATAKKKYILKRLFPPKKKMIADYRVLEKKPYLLFALYIYRLFKAIFNSKATLTEFKAVNSIENKKSEK